jgi:hypothetical protein
MGNQVMFAIRMPDELTRAIEALAAKQEAPPAYTFFRLLRDGLERAGIKLKEVN